MLPEFRARCTWHGRGNPTPWLCTFLAEVTNNALAAELAALRAASGEETSAVARARKSLLATMQVWVPIWSHAAAHVQWLVFHALTALHAQAASVVIPPLPFLPCQPPFPISTRVHFQAVDRPPLTTRKSHMQAAAELLQLPQICEALAAVAMDEPTPAPTPTASGISGSGFHPGEPSQGPDTARGRLLSPSALQRLTSLGSKLSAAEDLLHGPAAASKAGESGAGPQSGAPALKQGEEEVTSSAATSSTVAAVDASEVRSSAGEHARDSESVAGSPSAARAEARP